MTSAKDIPKRRKRRGEPIRAAWAEERKRLLREAIRRTLSETRHMGQTRKRMAVIEAIRANYSGREIFAGHRLRISPSRFRVFIRSARRGKWDFLTIRHGGFNPEQLKEAREWAAALASAAPVDPAEAIRAGEAIAGRRLRRDWQARRAAILSLACAEIEARAAAVMSLHRACQLAARHYDRADIGDGRQLAICTKTAWRIFRKWRTAGRTPEAFRLAFYRGPKPWLEAIPAEHAAACVAFAKRFRLNPAAAAREISRRFILPCSERTLQRKLRGRGLPHFARKGAAPAHEIQAELDRLAEIFPARGTN